MNNLKTIREAKRFTQKQLAGYSGVTLTSIQKYETGQKDLNKAQALTVYKLARALNCEMSELLTV